jgi:predicted dehydrogenase
VTLDIGLVGCGRWGQLILRDLVQCGARVHVVARNKAADAAARLYGASEIVSDLAQLGDMDGYVIATPTVSHASVVEALLPKGQPIFVEKPMTADRTSARRLTQMANGRLFVMDKWRYHPAIEAMRSEIVEGRVGDVIAIQTVRTGWGNPHDDVSVLWILAPHDLSIVLHLTGLVPNLLAARALSEQMPDLGFTAFLGGQGMPSVEITIGAASPDHQRRILVVGSKATLELRGGYDDRIFVREGAPGSPHASEQVIEVGKAMPLLSELQRFLDHVKGGPAPMSSAEDGLIIVERLAEIEAALASGSA